MQDNGVCEGHICNYYCDNTSDIHAFMVLIDDENNSLQECIDFFNWLYVYDSVVDLRPAPEADIQTILAKAESAWLDYTQVPIEYTFQKPYTLWLKLNTKRPAGAE